MNHINYKIILKLDVCSTLDSNQLKRNIENTILNGNKKYLNSLIEDFEIDKVSLCKDDCFDEKEEVDGEKDDY